MAGGILAVVGFGLSFVTFGASLGLCIAGIQTLNTSIIASIIRHKEVKDRYIMNELLENSLLQCKAIFCQPFTLHSSQTGTQNV